HQANEGSFNIRKRNALKAYFEWMPVREPKNQFKNWKRYKVGNLVDIKLLETRLSSRSEQIKLTKYITKEGIFLKEGFYKILNNKKRNLLGKEQLNFVKENVGSNQAWNVYAQQVLLASLKLPSIPSDIIDMLPDYQQYYKTVIKEDLPYNLDAWDGYPSEREKFLKIVGSTSKKNLFIAGDTHNCWANNIMLDDKFVGAELATPSVTSPGASENFNGMISSKQLENAMMLKNKNLKWTNLADRGYLTINFKPEIATTEFIAVDTISSRNYKTKILKRVEITPEQELT
ncbi:MAG: alkaline phosphatase D family protein, partial [Proteobacteria bacterium]|nr:alkaline phosphatase D family protein [Pseudomonadota bacterium]